MQSPSEIVFSLRFIATLTVLALVTATARLLSILPPRARPVRRARDGSTTTTPAHLMVLLGSGGHTAEMLDLLRGLDPAKYGRRTYVVSSGDRFSEAKAEEFEARLRAERAGERTSRSTAEAATAIADGGGAGESRWGTYRIVTIPRARHIHQSIYSTPITAVQTLLASLRLLVTLPTYPNVILTNGPGTAVLLILATFLLRFFNLYGANRADSMRTIYIESWARVKALSLTGVLLSRVVDRLLVQWEALEGVAGRGEFRGALIH